MLTIFTRKKHRILEDHFGTGFPRRVLLSGVNRPFVKGAHLRHNNITESLEMAAVCHELGYRVDVINHDNPMAIDYDRYHAVFGWGPPLENVFRREAARLPRTILYMNGTVSHVSNAASLERLEALYRRRGVWLPGSARLGGEGLSIAAVVDGVVVLGNSVIAQPVRALTGHPVFQLPLFFHAMPAALDVPDQRDLGRARSHFMWFSGSGLVHKGLDLVLEAFAGRPHLHLHVHGDLSRETGFLQAYHHELRELPNVHVEGFLPLDSPRFRSALLETAFIICPSCAEACCSSVLNVCGNGGHVPVLTRECGIDTQEFGIGIAAGTVASVAAALDEAAALDDAAVARRIRDSAAFFRREHSLEGYHQRLKAAVGALLTGAT
jgi:glycosyltransferase involved in cell wall biosynthesis